MRQKASKDSEQAVQKVVSLMQSFVNPFSPSDCMASVSSGVQAPPAVEKDLLDAHNKASTAMLSFFSNRLVSSEVDFHHTITTLQLHTFSTLLKAAVVKSGNVQALIRADRNLFARLAVVAQTRSLNMQEALSYELSPLPRTGQDMHGNSVGTTGRGG